MYDYVFFVFRMYFFEKKGLCFLEKYFTLVFENCLTNEKGTKNGKR